MSVATEAEMLAEVKAWAEARGWLRRPDDAVKAKWHGRGPWCVEMFAFQADAHPELRGPFVQVWAEAQRNAPLFRVSPAVALAWAILVESEPPPADVGPCRTCRGRRRWSWWEQGTGLRAQWLSWAQLLDRDPEGGGSALALAGAPWSEGSLLRWDRTGQTEQYRNGVVVESTIGGWRSTVTGTCPACHGSGRKFVPVPRRLLDATTDPASRAEEYVRADWLLASGHPSGLALAWALRWSDGEGVLDGTGEAAMLVRWLAVARVPRCPTCNTRRGVCCSCGGDLGPGPHELAPDPYAEELHGDDRLHMQCSVCAFEAAQDI